jgi:hypothetical protein
MMTTVESVVRLMPGDSEIVVTRRSITMDHGKRFRSAHETSQTTTLVEFPHQGMGKHPFLASPHLFPHSVGRGDLGGTSMAAHP